MRLSRIRAKEEDVGLRECKASFLRLMHKPTNGSRIEVNATGTTVESAKGVMLSFIADVYINTDHSAGRRSGLSPEDLGRIVGHRLCEEIYRGGCVDSSAQNLSLLLMALGPRDVSKIVLGPLTEQAILFLRLMRDFFGVTFKLETINDEDQQLPMGAAKISAVCVGIGFSNISKKST